MRRAAAGGAGQLAALRPMRAALARMAAALRGTVAVAAVASALLGAGAPVPGRWLAPALALAAAWTAVYVRVAWTRGLLPWLIAVDLLLAAALYLAIGQLVRPAAVPGTLSWVSTLASMAVVTAQLAGLPAVWLPAALLVAACSVAGSRLAHSPDGGIAAGILLASQAAVAAAVMVVALRTERVAVRAFAELQAAEAAAALALARRADERAQLRLIHNGPLTTLTMALHADPRAPGPVLRQRAAATLAALPQLAAGAGPPAGGAGVRLDERLAQVVVWYQPPLRIAAELPPCLVPAQAADAFAGAVAEALENVVRYAGTDRATVTLREDGPAVTVTVTDRGRGFDPAGRHALGFGVREDLLGRMAAAGGSASLRSGPGAGTVAELEWRRA